MVSDLLNREAQARFDAGETSPVRDQAYYDAVNKNLALNFTNPPTPSPPSAMRQDQRMETPAAAVRFTVPPAQQRQRPTQQRQQRQRRGGLHQYTQGNGQPLFGSGRIPRRESHGRIMERMRAQMAAADENFASLDADFRTLTAEEDNRRRQAYNERYGAGPDYERSLMERLQQQNRTCRDTFHPRGSDRYGPDDDFGFGGGGTTA